MAHRKFFLTDYAKNFLWTASTGAGYAFGIFVVLKLTGSSITVNTKK